MAYVNQPFLKDGTLKLNKSQIYGLETEIWLLNSYSKFMLFNNQKNIDNNYFFKDNKDMNICNLIEVTEEVGEL